jgi:lipopolysaccharide transport system ATP-binding protein
MSDDVLIRVEGVSKKFCRDLKRSLWYGVKDTIGDLLGRDSAEQGPRPDEFWAVDNVSFELRRGEGLGLIGRNGAGKTTLLKMLNGLVKPDRGRIEIRGRVGALIALGAGFNPVLTGRENIYVNGAVLGLSKKEIDAKFEEIVEFAEIGEFIDAPVQNYSSGMQVRLGFAVATAMEPDVLLLDEVLAVGDVLFRQKCYTRIGQLSRNAAIILVTHQVDQASRVSRKGLFMRKGMSSGIESIDTVVDKYERDNEMEAGGPTEGFERLNDPIVSASFVLDQHQLDFGATLRGRIGLKSRRRVASPFLRLLFYSMDGVTAAEWNSEMTRCDTHVEEGESDYFIDIPSVALRPSTYFVTFMIVENGRVTPLVWLHKRQRLEIRGPRLGVCPYMMSQGTIASHVQKAALKC